MRSQVSRLFNGTSRTNAVAKAAQRTADGHGGPTTLAPRDVDGDNNGALVVHTLRLLENTDRFSTDMQALEKGS